MSEDAKPDRDHNGERGEVPVHGSGSGATLPWWVARHKRLVAEYLAILNEHGDISYSTLVELLRINARHGH
jgi:hypothetical protein